MAASPEHSTLPLPDFTAPVRLLIVVAPYYRRIADDLILGAQRVVVQAGGIADVVEVPGALEIPAAIALAAGWGKYDGFVALGCVVRGETTHYETVCNDSSRGLMELGLAGHCIGNGILTVESMDQAVVRADPEGQDKGGGAAAAALHLVALKRRGEVARGAARHLPENRDPLRLAGELDGRGQA